MVEIINPIESNIIDVIYRHTSIYVTDVNGNYLNGLLGKISKEEKNIFLGDFNVNLLNYNDHRPTNRVSQRVVRSGGGGFFYQAMGT